MPQPSLHLHQAAGSWSTERLWPCIADERPHPNHFHPRQDPGCRPDALPRWQQMKTLAASPHCSQSFHEWSSAKVHMLFHMSRRRGQGTVWMRAFRQACRRCPDPRLEEPKFIVVDALVAGPHNTARCEGCQLGVCSASQRLAPASDAWEPLMDADEARTHLTLKRQGMRPYATPTHHPSPFSSNFPWKCCCCIGSSFLSVLAVLLFILLYFTEK
uniref:3CxxC-type domain-containing protein n=1 Tax=Aquila chrysaetos chrysaetos TaxID=223781 RepID=A0A663E3I1_AQUCH